MSEGNLTPSTAAEPCSLDLQEGVLARKREGKEESQRGDVPDNLKMELHMQRSQGRLGGEGKGGGRIFGWLKERKGRGLAATQRPQKMSKPERVVTHSYPCRPRSITSKGERAVNQIRPCMSIPN